MANHTKRIILDEFQCMLKEMPFDKITVSALVKRCEISPNTFYYHYQDIFSLLDDWLVQWLGNIIKGRSTLDHWQEAVKALLYECKAQPQIINHVLAGLSRERIERALFSLRDDWFYDLVRQRAEGETINDKKLRDIAAFCRYAFIGFFLQFVWMHMAVDVENAVDELSGYFHCFVQAAIQNAGQKIT